MSMNFRVTEVRARNGQVVKLPPAGIVCIVGSNNAGKSQLLRDIVAGVSLPKPELVTISEVSIERPRPTRDECEEWLERNAIRVQERPIDEVTYMAGHSEGLGISVDEFYEALAPEFEFGPENDEERPGAEFSQESLDLADDDSAFASPSYLGEAGAFLTSLSTAGSLSEHVSAFSDYGPGGGPLALLKRDGDLEDELSALTFATFGMPVILDRVGEELQLRVGTIDVSVPPINRPTREYADAVASLPTLEEQGDGFKSFVGLALRVMTNDSTLLLVDEPEAFLHPGQARALGRWLAGETTRRGVQLFISTHDRDVVLGLIEGGAAVPVNVIRITRHDNVNVFSQLQPHEVSAVWSDPVLRYSNVMQGLFHKRVAICEGDADCRFYGAALDEFAISTNRRAEADDVLFVPSGGKHRVAALARALSSLMVEAHAVVDFDILRSRSDVQRILESVGGVWTEAMNEDYLLLAKSVSTKDEWDRLKKIGVAGIRPGEPFTACENLLQALRANRVHIVPVGETEDFDKTISLHGAGWTSEALEKGIHRTDGVLALVRRLVDGAG